MNVSLKGIFMLKKILVFGMAIGMLGEAGALQVSFDRWSGKYIVEDIILNQEYPGKAELLTIKGLLPDLIGGVDTIESKLSSSWETGFTVHDSIPENLKSLRDRIVDELCELDDPVPHSGN